MHGVHPLEPCPRPRSPNARRDTSVSPTRLPAPLGWAIGQLRCPSAPEGTWCAQASSNIASERSAMVGGSTAMANMAAATVSGNRVGLVRFQLPL